MNERSLKRLAGVLLGSGLLLSGFGAQAAWDIPGDWLVRVRGLYIMPNDNSSTVRIPNGGAGLAGSSVGVGSDAIPELDITYMFTKHWGTELILGTSSHSVNPKGTLATAIGGADIINTDILPPTLTLQYHFMPDSHIRPYVGFGVNYTWFYNSDVAGGLKVGAPAAHVHLSNSWGWAGQAGVDVDINKSWFVNLDLKYIDMSTTAEFSNLAAGIGSASVDVNVDPWVFGFGIGHRF
jgi:outer membrane protein